MNEILSKLIASGEYKNASPAEKVKMFEDARALAADEGRARHLAGQGVEYAREGWKAKIRDLANVGVDSGAGMYYRNMLSGIEKDGKAAGLNGSEINRIKRDYLYSLPNLSDQQKDAIDNAFIDDTVHMPKEVNANYSGDYDSFILSQLSEAGQRNWAYAQAAGMNAQTYALLYPLAANSKKNKTECIYDLMAAGLDYEQAMYFYKIANKAKSKN